MRTEERVGRRVLGVVMAALLTAPGVAGAQSSGEFIPVTDEMLQNPADGDWLSWRRTPAGWGYSPLDEIDRDNVHRIRMVWSRGLAEGRQEGTPLAYRRHPLHAAVQRRHRGDRRGDRRPDLAAPARSAGGRLRVRRRQRAQQPEHLHLRPVHRQHERRRLHLRARRHHRGDRLGDADLRLQGDSGRAQLGADHRRRQGRLRAKLPPAGRSGVVRDRGPRRAHRRGAVAAADGARAGRAGRRNLGRRALRGADPRRHLGCGQLRPRAAVVLPGDVGHVAGSQVHARRRRQRAPVPQLDAGLSTSTPARFVGTTST